MQDYTIRIPIRWDLNSLSRLSYSMRDSSHAPKWILTETLS